MEPNAKQIIAHIIMEEASPQGLADTLTFFLGDEMSDKLANFMIMNYGYNKDRIMKAAAKVELDDSGCIDDRQWNIKFDVTRK